MSLDDSYLPAATSSATSGLPSNFLSLTAHRCTACSNQHNQFSNENETYFHNFLRKTSSNTSLKSTRPATAAHTNPLTTTANGNNASSAGFFGDLLDILFGGLESCHNPENATMLSKLKSWYISSLSWAPSGVNAANSTSAQKKICFISAQLLSNELKQREKENFKLRAELDHYKQLTRTTAELVKQSEESYREFVSRTKSKFQMDENHLQQLQQTNQSLQNKLKKLKTQAQSQLQHTQQNEARNKFADDIQQMRNSVKSAHFNETDEDAAATLPPHHHTNHRSSSSDRKHVKKEIHQLEAHLHEIQNKIQKLNSAKRRMKQRGVGGIDGLDAVNSDEEDGESLFSAAKLIHLTRQAEKIEQKLQAQKEAKRRMKSADRKTRSNANKVKADSKKNKSRVQQHTLIDLVKQMQKNQKIYPELYEEDRRIEEKQTEPIENDHYQQEEQTVPNKQASDGGIEREIARAQSIRAQYLAKHPQLQEQNRRNQTQTRINPAHNSTVSDDVYQVEITGTASMNPTIYQQFVANASKSPPLTGSAPFKTFAQYEAERNNRQFT